MALKDRHSVSFLHGVLLINGKNLNAAFSTRAKLSAYIRVDKKTMRMIVGK